VARAVHFFICFGLWMLLTWCVQLDSILAGLVVAALSATFLGHLFPRNARETFALSSLKRLLWFIYYVPVFLVACMKANVDVAYRVLHMNLPIRPGIVRVKTGLKSEMGRTFLANSITLTPGTLAVDIIGEDLYVHWIAVSADDDPEAQTRIIVSQFERILKKVFEP